MNKQDAWNALHAKRTRSAWERGVLLYAEDLLEDLDDTDQLPECVNRRLLRRAALNGADNWKQYSEGGCAYCYDSDIAERLCAPWELRRTDGGRLNPNARENWIDVQARALAQAYYLIEAILCPREVTP